MKTLDELYNLFCEHRKNEGKEVSENSYYQIRKFIEFSKESCYTQYFDHEVFEDWCYKRTNEKKVTFDRRIASIRQFIIFINRYGYVESMPVWQGNRLGNKRKRKIRQTEQPFLKTCISDILEDYIKWIKSVGKYVEVEHDLLIRFNKRLDKDCPDSKSLTDDMVKKLFEMHSNESAMSCNARNRPVRAFLEYSNWTGRTNVSVPPILHSKRKEGRIPHAFSDTQLQTLFKVIDNVKPMPYENDKTFKFRRIQYSTFFRLLYSTGMRTNEARELKRSNVDLVLGVINIEKTKGYHQHRVALHHSVIELLKLYDEEMDKLMPNREVFFPDLDGGYHHKAWQSDIFHDLWRLVSDEDARAYDFRSNYAVRNINSWQLGESKWIDKFMYLSRSMGHSSLNATAYYYHLVPMFREKLEEYTGENLSKLHPDMDDFLDSEYYDDEYDDPDEE